HALRNALGPLVTLVGLDLGTLLAGAIVTEYIFAWPGIGREVLQAILEVDNPLVLGVVLVAAVAIALANLLVDLAYLWLDPGLCVGSRFQVSPPSLVARLRVVLRRRVERDDLSAVAAVRRRGARSIRYRHGLDRRPRARHRRAHSGLRRR